MHKSLYALLALLASATLAHAKTVVIDVRTPAEFAQGHVSNAINIDHTAIEQRIGEAKVNKDDTVILYCRSGRRSPEAKSIGNTTMSESHIFIWLVSIHLFSYGTWPQSPCQEHMSHRSA